MVSGTPAFQALQHDVGQATEGVAMAIAMGGASILPCDKSVAVSTNWGTFSGQNAVAVHGVARLTRNPYFNGGVGVGTNHGTVGGRAGVTFTR